ncbi:hypothetical protein [Nannocystis exedens]|uniref:hypothetical protein n=1 Tax=Nannocystis exedens TaxID=54 RepID=UPI0011804261|nr:hypothetical protein [Nannocystis exedens]
MLFVAVLSRAPAETTAEPWRPLEAECQRREDAADYAAAGDACRRAFEAVPDGPLALNQRSLFAFKAVRLYKRAHKAGSDVAVLCPAVALLQAFSAQLATLPEGERPRDRADVADALQTLEGQLGGACTETPPDDLIEVGGADDRPKSDPLPKSEPPAARPVSVVRPLPQADTQAKRRPLGIAGWTTLGTGLGFGSAAIAMLARAAAMQAQVDGLNAMYPAASGVKIPADDAQRFHDATARGEQANRLAIGLGLPAIGLVLSGVALLAIDAHRERAGRRVALRPSPAGIGFRMEF